MRWLKRLLWFFLVLALLLGAGYWYLCRWLRGEVERRARETLGVEVSVDDLSLNPFTGAVTLYHATVHAEPTSPRDLLQGGTLSVAELTLWLDLGASYQGNTLAVDSVRVVSPQLDLIARPPSIPPSFGDAKRLRAYFRDNKPKERRATLPRPLRELIVTQGNASLQLRRDGVESSLVKLSNIEYQAQQVTEIGLTPLLAKATYQLDIDGAKLERKADSFSLSGLSLQSINAVFGSTDTLRFSEGSLDLSWSAGTATITLHQPRLSGALSVVSFGDEFSFSFPMGTSPEAQQSAVFVLAEFWSGLGGALLDKASDKARDQLMKEALKSLKQR
jgi:hypothetical protein